MLKQASEMGAKGQERESRFHLEVLQASASSYCVPHDLPPSIHPGHSTKCEEFSGFKVKSICIAMKNRHRICLGSVGIWEPKNA